MSNRQKATSPWLGRRPRPAGVVYSATHGQTVFGHPVMFKVAKVKPCDDEKCGIASTPKSQHVHPAVPVR